MSGTMRSAPKVIHISDGLRGAFCGHVQTLNWPEEWMDDKKARTLPRCPKCVAVLEGKAKRPEVLFQDEKVSNNTPKTKSVPNPVTKKGYITLRQYLG